VGLITGAWVLVKEAMCISYDISAMQEASVSLFTERDNCVGFLKGSTWFLAHFNGHVNPLT